MGTSRRIVATLAALVAAFVMRSWDHGRDLPFALWIPTIALLLTAVGLHVRSPGVRLVVRAVWWANLMLGTMIATVERGHDGKLALLLALSTGIALLAAGRASVEDHQASTFRPVAFRTALSLSMLMAVADAEAFALFGGLQIEYGLTVHMGRRPVFEGMMLLGCAVVVSLAAFGLYRLRVWGLVLNTVSSVTVLCLAMAHGFGIKGPLANMIAISAAVQLLLPLPMIVAIVRRTPASALARPSRFARFVPATVVLAMMLLASISTLTRGGLRF